MNFNDQKMIEDYSLERCHPYSLGEIKKEMDDLCDFFYKGAVMTGLLRRASISPYNKGLYGEGYEKVNIDTHSDMGNYEERKSFENMIGSAIKAYKDFGARSSKKVDIIHNYLVNEINKQYLEFTAKTEVNVPCNNLSGRKKHDIVVYDKDGVIVYIICVKFIMSNYNQNKNNYIENLVGETYLTKLALPNVKIISFYICFDKIPYKNKGGHIVRTEILNPSTVSFYESLCNKSIYDKSIFYIFQSEKNLLKNMYQPINTILI